MYLMHKVLLLETWDYIQNCTFVTNKFFPPERLKFNEISFIVVSLLVHSLE